MSDAATKEKAQFEKWRDKYFGAHPFAACEDAWLEARASLDRSAEPKDLKYRIDLATESKFLLRDDGSEIGPDCATDCEMELWSALTTDDPRSEQLEIEVKQCHEILDSLFADHAVESTCANCRDHSVGYRAARLVEIMEDRSRELEQTVAFLKTQVADLTACAENMAILLKKHGVKNPYQKFEDRSERLAEALRRAAEESWQVKTSLMEFRESTELIPQKEEWIAAKIAQWSALAAHEAKGAGNAD